MFEIEDEVQIVGLVGEYKEGEIGTVVDIKAADHTGGITMYQVQMEDTKGRYGRIIAGDLVWLPDEHLERA